MGQDQHDPHAWPLRQRPASDRQGAARTTPNAHLHRRSALRRPDAPCLLDGPIDADSFLAWIEQFLAPTLRPGDIVVMDNLSSHKNPAIRCAIRTAGAKLFYLPKYSPDLNPIEQAFAKLKTLLRKANARSFDAAEAAIAALWKTITPIECRNFFTEAGYVST